MLNNNCLWSWKTLAELLCDKGKRTSKPENDAVQREASSVLAVTGYSHDLL